MKKYIVSLACMMFLLIFVKVQGVQAYSLQNYVERSDNIRLYTNNVKSFHGCNNRIGKADKENGYIIYKLNNARAVKVTAYSDVLIEEDRISFSVSSDGDIYNDVRMYREFYENGNVGYQGYILIAILPEGAEYFKITLHESKKFCLFPQIGDIEFSSEANAYNAKGLLFEEEFENTDKMYDISSNFRVEIADNPNTLGDVSRIMRVYDLKSSIKYKIKNPISLRLRYFIMDGKGEVEVWASPTDGKYTKVDCQVTAPEHSGANWSVVYLTADNFPEGTEYVQLVLPVNGHAVWPPMLSRMEVYY